MLQVMAENHVVLGLRKWGWIFKNGVGFSKMGLGFQNGVGFSKKGVVHRLYTDSQSVYTDCTRIPRIARGCARGFPGLHAVAHADSRIARGCARGFPKKKLLIAKRRSH